MKKKKLIVFIIAFLLTLAAAFAFPAEASAAAYYSDIRVLLSVDPTEPAALTLIGEYSLDEDPSFAFASDKVTVSVVGNRPVLTSGEKTFTASSITFKSRDYGGTKTYIRLKNDKYGVCTYLGDLSFTVKDGKFRVINTLPVEHYLYGVVPHEMSNTFPVESLKAQAVCARGYAVASCSGHRTKDYDILDTSEDQVYHGFATRYTRAIAAVDETRGQVLTYDGDIIQAYYSASNGGQTELPQNVWTKSFPYYVQMDDPYDIENPSSQEDKSFIPAVFTDEAVQLMDRLVLRMLQDGADKAAGGAARLLSVVSVKAYAPKYDPPSRSYTKADVVLMVSLADGRNGQVTVTLQLDDLVYSKDNPRGIFNTGTSLRMRGAEPGVISADGKEYTGWFLTNRRYGHGIGLSQRGAQQRATGGQNFKEIVSFYYADTSICTMGSDDTAPKLKSGKYAVSKSFISGIAPGTAVQELLSGISPAGGAITVISPTGAKKTDGPVATGDFIRTVYNDGASAYDLPLLIYGDLDGDGKIAKGDLDLLRRHLMNTKKLTGVCLLAADVNRDDTVDSLDVLKLLKHIEGTGAIKQGGKSN
jgi:SpoIID/LytB domain protein